MKFTIRCLKPGLWMAALLILRASAMAETAVEERPRIQLPRVATPPRLSDYLGDEGRRRPGLRITDFRQREPNDGAPAILQTIAYLSFDEKNLCAVFLCREDSRLLRAHVSRREEITDDDRVSITLDTFHDGRRACEFFANPLGVQREGVITEGKTMTSASTRSGIPKVI
jgi:hypothetical protein